LIYLLITHTQTVQRFFSNIIESNWFISPNSYQGN